DQVLSNLIENACKYTPSGAEISVRARIEGDHVRVEIADRGPGIPPELLSRIFEPFFTGANQRVKRPAGVGLGLAVVKGLIEAHGGGIGVENGRKGGAMLVFPLPLNVPLEPQLPAAAVVA